MDLQQMIADLAADGIETDSNNIFLNIGKSYYMTHINLV